MGNGEPVLLTQSLFQYMISTLSDCNRPVRTRRLCSARSRELVPFPGGLRCKSKELNVLPLYRANLRYSRPSPTAIVKGPGPACLNHIPCMALLQQSFYLWFGSPGFSQQLPTGGLELEVISKFLTPDPALQLLQGRQMQHFLYPE